ncbi:MAG: c-type cytochrome [Terriglobia bacterium]
MKLRMIPVVALIAATLALGSASFAATSNGDSAQLFKSKCSMCHGMDGKGYPAIHTPNFTSATWQEKHSDAQIVNTITNGKKGTAMPAFGNKLSADQIQGLLHYIRSLGEKKG